MMYVRNGKIRTDGGASGRDVSDGSESVGDAPGGSESDGGKSNGSESEGSKSEDSESNGSKSDTPTVLVVDDESGFAESVGLWLEHRYDVRVATDAQSAIDQFDPSVDVVILDRRMPEKSGDEVLAEITDVGDPMVALVSAVEPDTGVLDLPFDIYLHKPVTRDDIRRAVSTLVVRRYYQDEIRDLLATKEAFDTLQAVTPTYELVDDERFLSEREAFEQALEDAGVTRHDLDRLAEMTIDEDIG